MELSRSKTKWPVGHIEHPTIDPASGQLATSRTDAAAISPDVTALWFCRCMDCAKLRLIAPDCIVGTWRNWSDGKAEAGPMPDEWHYCAGYDGPKDGHDVWLWPKTKPLPGAGQQHRALPKPPAQISLPKRLQGRQPSALAPGSSAAAAVVPRLKAVSKKSKPTLWSE